MSDDNYFGKENPEEMPRHFFSGTHSIDYSTAIKANVDLQNCSICPRFWYVDAYFKCKRCDLEYCFSAEEQKVWFEKLNFWIDAFPKHCHKCRKDLRELKIIRKKYDAMVSEVMSEKDINAKAELTSIIDHLYELGGELPPRIHENRRILAQQLEKYKDALIITPSDS